MSPTKPKLRHISPWVYFSSWSFSVLNLFFFAPTFFFADGSRGLILVGVVPSLVWTVVFLGLGVGMVYGLLVNRWDIVKFTLASGFIVKALFAWALIFSFFVNPATLAIVGLWFGVMVWQGLCIVYFTPALKDKREPHV